MELGGPRVLRDGTTAGGSDFTDDQVLAALQTHRFETFRYEQHRIVADVWVPIADITTLIRSCTLNGDDKAKNFTQSATFEIRDLDNQINHVNDAIRCFHQLRMPDGTYREWDKGTFYVPAPDIALGPSMLQAGTAHDALRALADSRLEEPFQVPTPDPLSVFDDGDPLSWAEKLIHDRYPLAGIDLGGPTALRVPAAAPKIYRAGTSILDVVNDLLAYCNFEHLRSNVTGSFVSGPWVPISERDTDFTYTADGQSVIIRESGSSRTDYWNAFNDWRRTVSHPGLPILRSRKTLDDPDNPQSTVYRGRTIFSDEVVDAPDQDTLDAILDRLFEEGQNLQQVRIETPLMPHNGVRPDGTTDKVELSWPTQPWGPAGNGTYILRGWTFPMTPGGRMQHVYESCPMTAADSGS